MFKIMKEKENYQAPEMEVLRLEPGDIICGSPNKIDDYEYEDHSSSIWSKP